jgi:pSer/pThr/pTyr-binding forkhead associated (FHA) protein
LAEVFCNQCGHRNPPGSRFCSSCGSALEAVRDDHTASLTVAEITGDGTDEEHSLTLDDLPPGSGLLVVKRGPNAGFRFVLDQDLVSAGRHPDSDIFLDDVTVSRRHAEIGRVGGHFVVRDVGSLNGTYLNRERIEEGRLDSGDELQIGKFKLLFFIAPGSRE